MTISREVREGQLLQGADEKIVYQLTTTPWGSAPTSIVVKAWDVTGGDEDGRDLHSASQERRVQAGTLVTCPVMQSLTAGKLYRLEIQFVTGGNTLEAYAIIQAEY